MQFSAALIIAAAAVAPVFGQTGAGYSHNATAVVTRTVTAYETYCPKSTTFTEGTKTYTATKEEWVTVKNCPKKCTITYNPSKPSVLPVGQAPKYGNNTVAACPCPKGKTDCPCDNKPTTGGSKPWTNGTNSGVPGTPGNPGLPGTTGTSGNPGVSGNNPSGTTPGSNSGNTGSNPDFNSDKTDGTTTLSTSAASTLVPGALLGLAAVAVYML